VSNISNVDCRKHRDVKKEIKVPTILWSRFKPLRGLCAVSPTPLQSYHILILFPCTAILWPYLHFIKNSLSWFFWPASYYRVLKSASSRSHHWMF
jgi:hypothetical protein